MAIPRVPLDRQPLGVLVYASALLVCLSPMATSSMQKSIVIDQLDNGGDNYLLLSENEITQDAGILKQLAMVSKEEIEEIVDENPILQQAVLDKVKKIVKLKQKYKANQAEVKLAQQEAIKEMDQDSKVGGQIEQGDSMSKLDSLRVQLASKAVRLYKISGALKKKIDKLVKKKRKLMSGHKELRESAKDVKIVVQPATTPRPKFYFRITSDSTR